MLLAVVGLAVWAPGALALTVGSPGVTGTSGDNGWYPGSAVTINWAVSDDEGKAITSEEPRVAAPVTPSRRTPAATARRMPGDEQRR